MSYVFSGRFRVMDNVQKILKTAGLKEGLEVWRVKKFDLETVPKSEYGSFYIGDSYIVLKTKPGNSWNIHYWQGDESTGDERGASSALTVAIDQALGDLPVQYRERQNHESSLFVSYFEDGIRYLSGGYDSGYTHVEDIFKNWKPKLYHCKGKRNIRTTQVDCRRESLNLGDVFILDLGLTIYVWMPPDSGRLERIKGMSRANNINLQERQGKAKVHCLDVADWNTDPDFWSYFGGKEVIPKIARAKDDDESYWRKTSDQVSLWRVCDESGGVKVTKIAQGDAVKKNLLDSKDAFILDAVSGGIFVWIGKNCTQAERSKAMEWGDNYLKQQRLPPWTQVTRVLDSVEPTLFVQWFADWQSEKKKNTFEPRLFQVSDSSGRLIVDEIVDFTQIDLDGDDVMILDAVNIIYVWVGSNATKNEKSGATANAQKYLEQGVVPRHKKATIETIFQGQENPTFKKFFPKWDDNMFANEERSVANMRKLLFH